MITSAYNAYDSTSLINNNYADYWFQYVFTNRYYMMYSKNIRYSVTGQSFKSIYTPVPPMDVQNKIAYILDSKISKIDQLIKNQQEQIEKLKDYKQSLISEVVTKGLDPNVEFKESGIEWINKIPSRWELIRVKDLSINTTSRNDDENLQYIALENIISQSFDYIDSDNVYDPKDGIYAAKYSVLFGKLRPYLAKSYYCEKDISCSSEFAVFPFDNEITSKYFLLLTQSYGFIDVINMSTYGTKMPRANINFINNLTIPLPPATEQINIVECIMKKIGKINLLIGIKNSKIDKLNHYKKSLIYEYVTGKKEVS
jgi:type I restriction enzyme S subunit